MPCFADRTLANVLEALASDAASPGSGAAAAIAMAFAAACAAKALAISRKHRPAEQCLQLAEQRLLGIVRRSLARGDADSDLFGEFIHYRSARTAVELVRGDESSQALATELSGVLDEITGAVHPVVQGDLEAARALLAAVNAILKRIRAENQQVAATGNLA